MCILSEIYPFLLRPKHLGHTGQTLMNERSSRSHAIFTITIECSDTGPDGAKRIRVGKLHMVDLAVRVSLLSSDEELVCVVPGHRYRAANVNQSRAQKARR